MNARRSCGRSREVPGCAYEESVFEALMLEKTGAGIEKEELMRLRIVCTANTFQLGTTIDRAKK